MNNSRLSLGKLYVRKYKAGQDSHPLPYQPEVRGTFGPAEANALPYSELAGLLWKEPSAGSLNMLKAVLHRARGEKVPPVQLQGGPPKGQALFLPAGLEPLRELYHQAREELDPRSISPVILQEQLGEADQPGPFFCEYDSGGRRGNGGTGGQRPG